MKCCATCEIIEALFMSAMFAGMGAGMVCSIWVLVDWGYAIAGRGKAKSEDKGEEDAP